MMIQQSIVFVFIGLVVGHVTAQAELNGVCSDNSNCTAPNAECRDDGTSESTKRCLCNASYVFYNSTGDNLTYCGAKVSLEQFPQCSTCEGNVGVCYLASVNDISSVGNVTRCSCPSSRTGDNCQTIVANVTSSKSSSLGTLCSTSSDCTSLTWNTECRDDGSNTGTKRCFCVSGFTSYSSMADNVTYCGQALSTGLFPACSVCWSNEGVCYRQSVSDTGSDEKPHCACPTSRTGANCEIVTVNVTCTGGDLAMKICYDPSHSGALSASGGLTMATEGHINKPSCLGSTVTNTSAAQNWCAAGNIGLVLNLTASRIFECGTTITYGITSKSYQNNIVIQQSSTSSSSAGSSLINFRAFCTFAITGDSIFQPLGSQVVRGDDKGQVVVPDISLLVLNQYDQAIPAGVIVRVGDLIRFVFSLNRNSSSYNSMTVQFCTASSSAMMPDANAETTPLIVYGCPASSTGSSWYLSQRNVGDPKTYSVQTNQVAAFRMPSSSTVYIHCNIRLCLVDDASCRILTQSDCTPSGRQKRSLADPTGYLGNFYNGEHSTGVKRLKRAASATSSQVVNIASRLDVYDPNSSASGSSISSALSSTWGIIAIIAVLVVVLIVIVTIGAIIMSHLGHHRQQINGGSPTAPQQFVMRRIPQSAAVGYSRF